MSLLSHFAHLQGSLKYAAALSLALGVSATTVQAQQQSGTAQTGQQPATGQQAPQMPQVQTIKMIPTPGQAWTKICGKDDKDVESCITTREFVIENGGRGIAVAVYDIKSKPAVRHARIMVPLGFKLPAGVKLGIGSSQDKNLKMHNGYYDVCLPPGCYVNFQNAEELVKEIEGGKEATLIVQDALGQPIFVHFPVDEFKEAFNGKPVDPEELERNRRVLEEELVKKSEEMRKQLLGEGTASDTSTTAPAGQ